MDYWYIILALMLIIIIVMVVLIIVDRRKYKHRIEIRELVQGRKRIKHDLARDFTDSDGGNFWRLKGEKDRVKKFLEVPPEEAIEIDYKGRKCVTLYRDETGSYLYLVDKRKTLGSDSEIEPLKTSHRIGMMDNFKKARARGGLSWWKENGMAIANLTVIVVLLIAIFVFWGDLYEPVRSHQTLRIKEMETFERVIDKLDDIDRKIQVVTGETENVKEPPN